MSEKMYEGWKPGQLPPAVRAMAERDIDNGPFPSLNLIADVYEDEGHSEIASGYRWLIEHRRVPRSSGPIPDPYWVFTDHKDSLRIPEYLPQEVRALMHAMPINLSFSRPHPLFNHFNKQSDAYRTAAICLGAHLNASKEVVDTAMFTSQEKLWHCLPASLKSYFASLSVPIPTLDERIDRRKKEIERMQFLEARDNRDRAERIARQLTEDFERQMNLGGMPMITTSYGSPPYGNPCSEIPLPINQTEVSFTEEYIQRMIDRLDLKPQDQRIFIDPKNVF